MCFPEGIALAIYGKSCSGKTTLANALSVKRTVTVRDCGTVIREEARKIKVHPNALPLAVHLRVDEETRRFASNSTTARIISGCFLDTVLSGLGSVKFIKIVCDRAERARRNETRSGNGGRPLSERDQDDELLSVRLYEGAHREDPWLTLDTSKESVDQLVERLLTEGKHL